MNIDTIAGEGTAAKGRIKESLGAASGDPVLEQSGIADELFGGIRKAFGAMRDFARAQPLAAAAVAAIIGASVISTMRRRTA